MSLGGDQLPGGQVASGAYGHGDVEEKGWSTVMKEVTVDGLVFFHISHALE